MLTCDGLSVRYGAHVALHRLDLTLGPGVTALLGPNGAGKTSLLRVLATAVKPHEGRMAVDGHAVVGRAALRGHRRRLGYMPQEFVPARHMTVSGFVQYCAWMREVPKDDRDSRVGSALSRVGLADRADARLGQLSGGMLRRVAMAQAVVNDPQLLLLDEPTAGLDPVQRTHLRSLVVDLGQTSTVLVSTHLADDADLTAGRVLVLDHGRLLFDGSPSELAARSPGADNATALEAGYLQLVAEQAVK